MGCKSIVGLPTASNLPEPIYTIGGEKLYSLDVHSLDVHSLDVHSLDVHGLGANGSKEFAKTAVKL